MDDDFDSYLSSATLHVSFDLRRDRSPAGSDSPATNSWTSSKHCLRIVSNGREASIHAGAAGIVLRERQVATIISAQKAQRRDYRLCESLRVRRDNPESRPGHRSCDSGKCDYPMLGIGHSESPEWNLLLKCDVERTMAILSPELRDVCRLLMVTDGIASVAALAGISRAALYRRISRNPRRLCQSSET